MVPVDPADERFGVADESEAPVSYMARRHPSSSEPVTEPSKEVPASETGVSKPPYAGAASGSARGRTQSSSRPLLGSLDARIEAKLRVAASIIDDLPATDSRVRLLHIAIMRRDESLLDGVLSELNEAAAQ